MIMDYKDLADYTIKELRAELNYLVDIRKIMYNKILVLRAVIQYRRRKKLKR